MEQYRYAYLHGFGSSPRSHKGERLAALFDARGLVLERPDLNRPSFATLDHAAMAAAIDELDASTEGGPWRFIGSSLGGWLAAYWASQNPARVDRMVLLCPGFHLYERWPRVVGDDDYRAWERDGSLRFPDANGALVAVHWGFIESAMRMPEAPAVPCQTLIIHGRRDQVVPIDCSRDYAAGHPDVRLLEVDDDHSLVSSMERVAAEVTRTFALPA
ncbi:MAG: alpha/beta fold hydrolase [Haliangiales bacterium]